MLIKSLFLLPAAIGKINTPFTLLDAKVSNFRDIKIGLFSDLHIKVNYDPLNDNPDPGEWCKSHNWDYKAEVEKFENESGT